tara:strand:+ start:723 stop:842 length:120 start_codon:yes stop_codon:yes gene_type:complete
MAIQFDSHPPAPHQPRLIVYGLLILIATCLPALLLVSLI